MLVFRAQRSISRNCGIETIREKELAEVAVVVAKAAVEGRNRSLDESSRECARSVVQYEKALFEH